MDVLNFNLNNFMRKNCFPSEKVTGELVLFLRIVYFLLNYLSIIFGSLIYIFPNTSHK